MFNIEFQILMKSNLIIEHRLFQGKQLKHNDYNTLINRTNFKLASIDTSQNSSVRKDGRKLLREMNSYGENNMTDKSQNHVFDFIFIKSSRRNNNFENSLNEFLTKEGVHQIHLKVALEELK